MATIISWDLDGDSQCDDAAGATATASFPTAGIYPVTVCASDGLLTAMDTRPLVVGNRAPTAAFTVVPSNPVAGEGVVITSASFDPDGPIVSQAWDLDGDGAYDDRTGEATIYSWPKAGNYTVGLRVTDQNGASAVSRVAVVVDKKPARRFRPEPFVRLISHPISGGAHIDLLTVRAPKGAKIGVRCRGRGCPYGRKSTTSKGKKAVDLRKLRRSYSAGAVIEIRITKADTIGKFIRIKIRADRRPTRVDRCLNPGKPNKPIGC